jgi:hypothetical protein
MWVSAAYWPLQAGAEETVPSPTGPVDIFGSPAVLAESLENFRGGADLYLNDIKSDGIVRDNQASNLTTGGNWVSEGSFTGASGFPTVIQNSGNNVLIQNATIINLQVK